MTDDKARAVRALRLLGRRVQQGLPKLAPVSEQHLAKVRAAVREQWQAKQPAFVPVQIRIGDLELPLQCPVEKIALRVLIHQRELGGEGPRAFRAKQLVARRRVRVADEINAGQGQQIRVEDRLDRWLLR